MKLSAAFASATNRFDLPDGIYHERDLSAPGVGAYDVSDSAASAPSNVGPAAGMARPNTLQGERFAGKDSIYGSSTPGTATPGVGEYNNATTGVVRGGGASSVFKDETDRFTRHDSFYLQPFVHDGSCGHEAAASLTALSFAKDSTFESATNRFDMPGSYLTNRDPSAPPVGSYELANADAATQAARVRGAVKLQAAIRRRQSRGIFAQIEAEASQKPGPGQYAPTLQPELRRTRMGRLGAEPNHGDAALFMSTLETLDEVSAVLAEVDLNHKPASTVEPPPSVSEQGSPQEPTAPAITSEEAPVAPSPAMQMPGSMKVPAEAAYEPFTFEMDETALASSPVVVPIREPPKGMRLSKVVSLDTWLGLEEEDDVPPPSANRPSVLAAANAEIAHAPETPGAISQFEILPYEEDEEDDAGREPEEDAADGDWLFSQLERIATPAKGQAQKPQTPAVFREDYFSDGVWDLDGLRSDLALYMQDEAVAPPDGAP